VDRELRFDALEARRVAWIEIALAVYGSTCALVSIVRGRLSTRQKIGLAACLPPLLLTGYAGVLMPRVIHD
jgi:hypothetical protein